MARVLFRRARNGRRAVRGESVRKLQLGLERHDASPGVIDGIFGRDTEAAVNDWQRSRGRPVTGVVDTESWQTLTGAAPPSILERCLQITGDFEGHGFGKVAGNFDGAGITWGIIGFTLLHGEVQEIVGSIRRDHPELLHEAFGPLEGELLEVMDDPRQAQLDWASRISMGTGKMRVLPEWESGFEALGSFEPVQAVQMQRVEKYWAIAERDADRFELRHEPGIALCFDIAVQNGGIDFDTEPRRIERKLALSPPHDEADRRTIIADVVAENSRPRYIEDVRSRKRTLATGNGTVHGAKYVLVDWAIDEVPWSA